MQHEATNTPLTSNTVCFKIISWHVTVRNNSMINILILSFELRTDATLHCEERQSHQICYGLYRAWTQGGKDKNTEEPGCKRPRRLMKRSGDK